MKPLERRSGGVRHAVALTFLAAVAAAPSVQARVTRIVIDSTTAPSRGQSIPYEQLRGRAFGELDPNDSA